MRPGWRDHHDPFLSSLHLRKQQLWGFHLDHSSTPQCRTNSDAEGSCMPADTTLDLLPAETAEPPAARRDTPQEQPDRLIKIPAAAPEKASLSPRRRFVRWAMFTLLPLALIAGAYWYVTGGQVMSTDDAYVEADTVGVSTDVSGIVKEIKVSENQHVDNGQVLYRLDP